MKYWRQLDTVLLYYSLFPTEYSPTTNILLPTTKKGRLFNYHKDRNANFTNSMYGIRSEKEEILGMISYITSLPSPVSNRKRVLSNISTRQRSKNVLFLTFLLCLDSESYSKAKVWGRTDYSASLQFPFPTK